MLDIPGQADGLLARILGLMKPNNTRQIGAISGLDVVVPGRAGPRIQWSGVEEG